MSPGSGAPEVTTDPPRSPEEEIGDRRAPSGKGAAAITLAALGIVFGDIGTSPLYALQTVFTIDDRAVRPDQASVYGVISLVFWAVTLIVSIKYVTLIMRADNHGEGGIMALIALVRGVRVQRRIGKLVLVSLGIFGASLFYGDGMITPAISVLSAVEGLEVAAPGVKSLVVPITLAILTVLFAVQRYGSSVVGRAFGPVMAVWFTILAASGLAHVIDHPGILRALAPTYGLTFLLDHGSAAFLALGAVVLTVTGAEALYTDMGHFGRPAIRRVVLRANLEHNRTVHGTIVIISLEPLNVPHVRRDKRIKHDDLGYKDDGICHMTARYGFQDDIDIPATLREGLDQIEGDVDLDEISYFISRATISPSDDPCMAMWRKKLFVAIARNASNPVQYFNLPDEKTVVMGAHVEL